MRFFIIIIAVLLCSPALQAASLEQQRDVFQEARKALNQHHIKQFDRLKKQLHDYPLTPYLDIWQARKTLDKGDDSLVAAALSRYADVPETINLRRVWLKYLVKKAEWGAVQRMIVAHPTLAKRFPVSAMMAAWFVGDKKNAMRLFSDRWVAGKAITSLSKPLYQAWLKQGHPSDVERWKRVGFFAKKGQWKKTRQLSQAFPKSQKAWLTYWRDVQKKPAKALATWPESLSTAAASVPAGLIINDGIQRLSRKDVVKAWQGLQELQSTQHQLDSDLFFSLQRSIALRAAKQHKQVAFVWLAQLPESFQTKESRGWQVRLAVLSKNWMDVLVVIGLMPEEQSQQDRWMYWRAQAFEALDYNDLANDLLIKLAAGRGYYNFLSAEQLGLGFHLKASKITTSPESIEAVEQMAGIRRAYEWLQLGKRSKATREWHYALADTDQAHWKAAAIIASRWQWHDQVIRAAFKAGEMDALVDRFPLSYATIVRREAGKTGLQAASIWSIIRQESAFNQYARSYVGAKGLMQLMPATARHVARKLHMHKGTPPLFSAATNIRLGASYLADMKQRFGSLALAAAAYNAGPHRVSAWLERVSFESPAAWLEAIPFKETRRYVQQVMAFVTVYEWRDNKPSSSLMARLRGRGVDVSFNQAVSVHEALK
ncbi:transglycosylase SLT domain-containing protein [Mariprofundus ferrooxydans]|nr:transglycosylase SLT domain-containing protein [Mariprofundus ferrooxydans]